MKLLQKMQLLLLHILKWISLNIASAIFGTLALSYLGLAVVDFEKAKHVILIAIKIMQQPVQLWVTIALWALMYLLLKTTINNSFSTLTENKEQDILLKYGIYWDKNKNPHCPTCKTALVTRSKARPLEHEFFCNSCNTIISPHNEKLQTITRQYALELISKPIH